MRSYLLFLILTVVSIQVLAQKIETDIFNNLKYESNDGAYEAYLKKDIFDDLIFTDNKNNEITLKKKYIDKVYNGLLENPEAKFELFNNMIYEHSYDSNYKASYSVDIFDKVIIEDNRDNKLEIGKDIFGNPTYEEKMGSERISIKRNLHGAWEYKSGNEDATLKKDIFDKWKYSDSNGNEFIFSKSTWQGLKRKFLTEDEILMFLIHEFLHI